MTPAENYHRTKIDITGKIGPLDSPYFNEPESPMYSYYGPSSLFWNGMVNGLIAKGMTEAKALKVLQSKAARWFLDEHGEEIERLGFQMAERLTL